MTTATSDLPTVEMPCVVPSKARAPSANHDQLVAGLDKLASILPPMPGIVARLQQELSNEWVNIQRLANLVRSDPTLAGSVLRVANSPYWRGSRQIVEIEDAIQRMGMETLRSLAMVLSLRTDTVSDKGPAGGTMRDFWRHSLLVAVGSVQIARRSSIDRKGLEQIWMAGLLHDIGAVLAPMLYPMGWTRVLQAFEELETKPTTASDESTALATPEGETAEAPPLERIDLLETERLHMSIDHAHIGSVFVQKHWNLPEPIPMIVDTWTDPTRIDPPLMAWIVARADQAAQTIGVCWQPERTRTLELLPLPKESGAGPACDPDLCLECVQKGLGLVDAILS